MKDKISFDRNDRLLLFGYGLFETLRITSAGIEIPKAHWKRMNDGGRLLNMEVPDYQEWLDRIYRFISEQSNLKPFALRATLSGGSPNQGHKPLLFFNSREIPYTTDDYMQGFKVCTLPEPRSENSILTRIKSTNYLENVLAREEAIRAGAQEGLWLNTKGYLTEGAVSNVFFLREGVLHTPSLDCGCLPGTRREVILQLASNLGIPAEEGNYTPSDLQESDRVFLTNSLMGIMTVSRIDDKPKAIQGSLLDLLMSAYREYMENNAVS